MEYSVNDNVFYHHKQHSWVLSVVKGVAPNPAAKKAAPGKQVSQSHHDVQLNDAVRKLEGETVREVPDWDLEHADMTSIDKTVDDLLNLGSLHEATLLRCLYMRYMNDIIYTNIGAIVVALNPFKYDIPHYLDAKMTSYLAEAGQMISDKLLPHSWAQAHNTFEELRTQRMNQCVLISGESGAGKTEATKIVMKYLARISVLAGDAEEKEAAEKVAINLTACSPILEAFGNAKTVRNDNSSRFGKLMRVKFDGDKFLLRGAFTTKYLLEKSRIVTAAQGERVYHSFYLVAKSKEAAASYGITQPLKTYKSINAGNCIENKEFSTAEDHEMVTTALETIGISVQAVNEVWQATAGVLVMCNVGFLAEGEGSKLDDSTKSYFDAVCTLWGVDQEKLLEECIAMKLVMRGETTRKLQPKAKAEDSRDALSKNLYDTLFSWLVERCNETCDSASSDELWIALLDIFGFEDFKVNSFEQLCINLTNETLQNHYNEYIFKKDIEQCRAEGIEVDEIKCPDNGPCLKLVQTAMKLLDDQCSVGTGTSQKFLDSVTGACGTHEFFFRKPFMKDSFGIKHYAGDVAYNTEGWIEKNRDTLREDIKIVMNASTVPLISHLYADTTTVKMTVGTFFKRQLADMMDVINSTNPHWIRCVKPHPAKKPRMFDGISAMGQLESSGVLGTVKIRKAGYPIRWKHARFCSHYKPIVPLDSAVTSEADLQIINLHPQAKKILQACSYDDPKFAQVGKTTVFMKASAYPLLEKKRNQALRNNALLMQRCGKGLKFRRRMMKLKRGLLFQRWGRGVLARGLCFDEYCDRNREKLIAAARAREEERRLQAERDKKTKEEQMVIMREEAGARDEMQKEIEIDLEEFWAYEYQERRIAEDALLAAQVAEQRRHEEERRKRMAEEAGKRFLEQLAVMVPRMEAERGEIEREEDDMIEVLLYAEWKARIKAEYFVAVNKLVSVEERRRARLEREGQELQEMFEDRWDELRRRGRVLNLSRDMRITLQKNREQREQEEAARRAARKSIPRNYIEQAARDAFVEYQRVQYGSEEHEEASISSSDEDDDQAQQRHTQHRASASVGRQHQDANFSKMLESSLEYFTPPRYRRDVATEVMEAAQERQNFMLAGSPSPRRGGGGLMKVLEVGQVVFIPAKGERGTVAEVISLSFGNQSARVLLEEGQEVWLEPDEVEIRDNVPALMRAQEKRRRSTPRRSHQRSPSPSTGRRGTGTSTASGSPSPQRASATKAYGQYFSTWKRQHALSEGTP